jgi:nucleotide-binding universal stress UspA family protein
MKILVGIDPNINNEELLQHIAGRPWPGLTEFHLVSVVEDGEARWEDVMARATTQVESAAAFLRTEGLEAAPFVLEGNPHEALLREASERAVDSILLGAPGVGSKWPHLRGATARRVVRHALCSVAIIRSSLSDRVLIATDGSKEAERAALAVTAKPWHPGTKFEAVSVVEPPSASLRFFNPAYVDSTEAREMRAAAMGHAEKAVETVVESLRYAGLEADGKVLVPLDAIQTLLLEEASSWNAALVVVGSHGRSNLVRFLIGSVSESLALHAACSVEVVR